MNECPSGWCVASKIQSSVGLKGANLADDVMLVQERLNAARDIEPVFGELVKELIADGKCGRMTLTAIVNYQAKVVLLAKPDGRIDPGGRTWKKLNECHRTVEDIPVMEAPRSSVDWWSDFFFDATESYLGKQLESTLDYFSQLFTWDADSQSDEMDDASEASPATVDVVRTYNQVAQPKAYVSFNQNVYKERIGESKTSTIAKIGCLLTSLTMAATVFGKRSALWPPGLKPVDLTPPDSNQILLAAGAFDGGALFVDRAARALGMSCKQYGWDLVNGGHLPLSDTDYGKLVEHVDDGLPVIAHVDYFKANKVTKDACGEDKSHPSGDHWVLITHKENANFSAIDPAGGTRIVLGRNAEMSIRESQLGSQVGNTRAVLWSEHIGVSTASSKHYRVVRFGLLSPT